MSQEVIDKFINAYRENAKKIAKGMEGKFPEPPPGFVGSEFFFKKLGCKVPWYAWFIRLWGRLQKRFFTCPRCKVIQLWTDRINGCLIDAFREEGKDN